MRSFAVVAGFAAAANAYAYGYSAQNTTSVAPPTYPATSTPAGYAVVSSAAGYAASSAVGYYTTTVKGLSTVCAEPTTLKVGTKTYTVTKSTTIIDKDCEYTTTVPVKATSTPVKASGASGVVVPGVSSQVVVPYPSSNGTASTYPVGTGAPSSTKPSPSQFTGAAAQTGAAMLAIVGAVAAFL